MKQNFGIIVLCLTIVIHHCSSKPMKETEVEDDFSSNDKRGIVSDVGNKVIGGFDRVVYGLMDEAMQYVTDDKQGAFKDMVVRHRADLYENIRKNLIHKDKITLNDVKATVMGEINNRKELFNYVGGGLWNKISSYSSGLLGQYKGHCEKNPDKLYCFNNRTKDDQMISSSSDEIEREHEP